MSSAAAIDARVDNLRSQELQTSFHGIAARLDRLPSGAFQRRAMWLIGGVCFCDCLDMNVGGPIIAELLASGWSDAGLNSLFVSITAFIFAVALWQVWCPTILVAFVHVLQTPSFFRSVA